jgi:hypothetical protein
LIRTTVRVRIIVEKQVISVGSGTLMKVPEGFVVLTAYHCVFGDEDQFLYNPISDICVESQAAFNGSFAGHTVTKVLAFNRDEDWALLAVDYQYQDTCFPPVVIAKNFKIETPVNFKGFQHIDPDHGRSFKAMVLDETANNEFRITLSRGDNFRGGADDAKGLSGSGAYIIADDKLYLIGILKSVNGDDAANNDIKCCPVSCIEGFLKEGMHDLRSDSSFDDWANRKFGEVVLSDPRDLIDKIKAVSPNISTVRIKKYCRELALGKEELGHLLERDLSALKYRIFEACQDDLIDFVEASGDSEMLAEDINLLLNIFTKKAAEILRIKSQKYKYPILDEDLLKKVVLDLINECYLSFDKEGIYNE